MFQDGSERWPALAADPRHRASTYESVKEFTPVDTASSLGKALKQTNKVTALLQVRNLPSIDGWVRSGINDYNTVAGYLSKNLRPTINRSQPLPNASAEALVSISNAIPVRVTARHH